jgi:hypothetical protein
LAAGYPLEGDRGEKMTGRPGAHQKRKKKEKNQSTYRGILYILIQLTLIHLA